MIRCHSLVPPLWARIVRPLRQARHTRRAPPRARGLRICPRHRRACTPNSQQLSRTSSANFTQKRANMEGGEPAAKKRGSARQITSDDPPSDEEDNEPKGPFATASAEVMAKRKIISARRKPKPEGGAATGTANPFGGISLLGAKPPTAAPAPAPAPAPAGKDDAEGDTKEANPEGQKNDQEAKSSPPGGTAPVFGSSAGKNPFAVGIGASSGFGGFAAAASGAPSGFGGFAAAAATATTAAATEGDKAEATGAAPESTSVSLFPPVSSVFGSSAAAPALFGGSPSGLAAGPKPSPSAILSDDKPVTGEEEDTKDFSADCTLFEFDDSKKWAERGKGEIRINVAATGQARFVMRQRGNYRLLLNANLWAGVNVTDMDGGKGVTFAVVNCAASGGAEEGVESKETPENEAKQESKLSTYAVRFKSADHVKDFTSVVNRLKGRELTTNGSEAAKEEV